MSNVEPPADQSQPREKVKQFPTTSGVYLMKDAQGRVLYVGKAKNLRNRAGHYFTQAALDDMRTCDLVKLIADIDFIATDSDVDALDGSRSLGQTQRFAQADEPLLGFNEEDLRLHILGHIASAAQVL